MDEQVKDLARKIMAHARPADLGAFDSGVDDLIGDPEPAPAEQPSPGGPLAADFGTVIMDMTPIVLYIARQVLDGFIAATTGELGRKAGGRLGRLFGRREPAAASTPEPPAEVKVTVINLVMGKATGRYGLSDTDVKSLTEAVRAACGLTPTAAADSA